jgi:hypothetical protein
MAYDGLKLDNLKAANDTLRRELSAAVREGEITRCHLVAMAAVLARARGLIEQNAREHGYTTKVNTWIDDYLKVRIPQ